MELTETTSLTKSVQKANDQIDRNHYRKAVFRQVLMATLANICIIPTGMGLGFPTISKEQLQNQTNFVHMDDNQFSWFASINAISCPLGGLLSGYLLEKVGRRYTIFAVNITSIISWGLLAFTFSDDKACIFTQIYISRFLIGIATGLASSPAGVYSAEICHPALRGRLTLGTSIAVSLGILFVYVLGFCIPNNFQFISTIIFIFSIISFIITIPIPESPNWLLMKNDISKAKTNLMYFRNVTETTNTASFDFEFKQLHDSIHIGAANVKPKFSEMLKLPEVYKPLLIMIGFFACQQFSGIFVVIVYAVQISKEAGVTINPLLCAIYIGLTRTITTFIVGGILDKWGRKPPAIISAAGMSASMMILATTIWYPNVLGNIPYLAVICVVGYIFTSTLGLMTLPFSMIAEVFPQKVRGPCAGITICCGYFMSFINIKLYPSMLTIMGKANIFAFYSIISIAAIFYIYYYLPETKGKTLSEIEEHFKCTTRKRNDNEQTQKTNTIL